MPLDASSSESLSRSDLRTCDVLIIGGGPAGSTAAAILASKGRRVVLLEKDRHPRFHIGESLLPQNLRVFDTLGIRERVAEIGVYKPGARFVSDEHGKHVTFNFAQGLNQDYTYSYQVKRADLDTLLFARARELGAETREGIRVTDVTLDSAKGHRIVATDADGEQHAWQARFVIDASGRDTFLAAHMQVKQRNPHNNTAAMFAHFRNVAPFADTEDGNITIHLFEHGWFWMIPLPGDVASVGCVSNQAFFKRRTGDIDDFFAATIASTPSMARRMAQAERVTPTTMTGNYSYASKTMAGDGWLMAGDAFAFVDPVFSSGVLLAMASAEMGAEAVDTWLDDRAAAAPQMRAFEHKVRRAIGSLSWLIYKINDPTLRDMFMEPRNRFRMREGLVSLLAGDVHSNTNLQLPVIAFKACYYALRVARWFGYRPGTKGMERVTRAA
jgi:flavin-dependent dehydrogenase